MREKKRCLYSDWASCFPKAFPANAFLPADTFLTARLQQFFNMISSFSSEGYTNPHHLGLLCSFSFPLCFSINPSLWDLWKSCWSYLSRTHGTPSNQGRTRSLRLWYWSQSMNSCKLSIQSLFAELSQSLTLCESLGCWQFGMSRLYIVCWRLCSRKQWQQSHRFVPQARAKGCKVRKIDHSPDSFMPTALGL